MSTPDANAVADLMANAKHRIAQHGWIVTGVFPVEGSPPESQPFVYTVGLTGIRQPELLMAGLPIEVAYDIVDQLAARVWDGYRIAAGSVIADALIDGYELVAVMGDARAAGMPLPMLRQMYDDRSSVLQLVWPDDQRRYPWDDGWSLGAGAQPVIGRPEPAP